MSTLLDLFDQKFRPVVLRGKKPKTVIDYRAAIRSFGNFLGRDATVDDLDDVTVSAFLDDYAQSGVSPRTVNNKMCYIRRFWDWLAKKRFVEEFPELMRLTEAQPMPKAWTADELKQLFDAIAKEDLPVGKYPGPLWWRTLHLFLLETGARIGETLAVRWDHYHEESGVLNVPAEIRKGGFKRATYTLRDHVRIPLKWMRTIDPDAELMFGQGWTASTLYNRYDRVLMRSGLPIIRQNKFHKCRRTYATLIELAGMDATAALMHTSRRTTENSYLDESQLAAVRKVYHVPLPAVISGGVV
ncbi:MAG: site-specific integrase [Pirellulales bacterium]|nr:site-specific integrase [Pirellulales bacterium]